MKSRLDPTPSFDLLESRPDSATAAWRDHLRVIAESSGPARKLWNGTLGGLTTDALQRLLSIDHSPEELQRLRITVRITCEPEGYATDR